MTTNPDDTSSAGSTNEGAAESQAGDGTNTNIGTTNDVNSTNSAEATATSNAGTQESAARAPTKPTPPKFGGVELDDDRWVMWTGGKPKDDWSGLNEENPVSIATNQWRGTSVSSRSKRQYYRTQGLKTKLTRTGDVQAFAKKLNMHFEDYGLDTVTYITSPITNESVVSVLHHHALYTLEEGIKVANSTKNNHFDKYALEDDKDAIKVLLNSVDDDIETQLLESCKDGDSFVVYWLKLIQIVGSYSLTYFEELKQKLRSRKLSDHAGENVEKLATEYLKDYKELHGARMYDHSLTLTMLDAILLGGTECRTFQHELLSFRSSLHKKILAVRHLSYEAQLSEMASASMDVDSVLDKCKSEYRDAVKDKHWQAANHNKDSKALGRNYGQVNQVLGQPKVDQEATQTINKLVNALVRKVSSEKSDGKKPFSDKKVKFQSKSNQTGRKPFDKKQSKKGAAARTPPPREGESEIKVIDGQKRYWCSKCDRWTLSHGTHGHKTTEELQSARRSERSTGRAANLARLNLDFHPAAFSVQHSRGEASMGAKVKTLGAIAVESIMMGLMTYLLLTLLNTAFDRAAGANSPSLQGLSLPVMHKMAWSSWSWVSTVIANVMQLITKEWIFVLVTALSGLIGFGTGIHLYCKAPDKPQKGRVRHGAAALKQARRRHKASHRPSSWTRRKSRGAIAVPKNWMVRNSLVHHDRFNNLGRNHCYESPRVLRIRYLRRKIAQMDARIQKLKHELEKAEYQRSAYQRELNNILHPSGKSWPFGSDRLCKSMCDHFMERIGENRHFKTPFKANWNRANWNSELNVGKSQSDPVPLSSRRSRKMHSRRTKRRSQIQRSVTTVKREHMSETKPSPLWTRFYKRMCCVASLVNLSNITSTDDGSDVFESVLFDSGANCCLTNKRSDFCGEIVEAGPSDKIDGIGKGLSIKGYGTVAWTFTADNGMYRTLRLPCYYVPSIHQRVASLQVIMDIYDCESIRMTSTQMCLSGSENDPPMTVPVHPKSRLHMAEPCSGPKHTKSTGPATPQSAKGKGRNYGTTVTRHPPTGNKSAKKASVSSGKNKTPKPALPTMSHPSLTTPDNINLSEPEKELLRWHHRLGHVNMRRVQWLFRQGLLATSSAQRRLHSTAANLSHGPLCTACQFAKQRQRTTPGTIKKPIKSEEGALKKDTLYPGQLVSIDHFDCKPLGRLVNTYGKESNDKRYKGGCIFVDHATGTVFVGLQSKLNSHETLFAKELFEKVFCDGYGVVVQRYLSDNGTAFTSKNYSQHLENFHQTIHHSSVGAHHSNGVAERNIGSLMSISRAMLHHAAIHWPEVADVGLWSLAVIHAMYILNHLPRSDTGRSPIELFSRRTLSYGSFSDLHVWGCPVYVLDSTLSSGHKLPRWKSRSSRGMYVGISLKHGTRTPLILNLETGAITPQFHVVFDDEFTTVQASSSSKINFDDEDWYHTFGLTPHQYVPDDVGDDPDDPRPHASELVGAHDLEASRKFRDEILRPRPETPHPDSIHQRELTDTQTSNCDADPPLRPVADPPARPLPVSSQPVPTSLVPPLGEAPPAGSTTPSPLQRENNPEPRQQREIPQSTEYPVAPPSPIPSGMTAPASAPQQTVATPPSTGQTSTTPARSPRVHSPPPRPSSTRPVTRAQTKTSRPATRSQSGIHRPNPKYNGPESPRPKAYMCPNPKAYFANDHARLLDTLFVGKAKANKDPDLYNWDEAMASPYKQRFLEAAQVEIDELVEKGTWREDLKCHATTKIIPSQWVFRIKRTPDGAIKKFKARIVLRGDLQEHDGRDNFSPVAAWSTVRTFLVISAVLNWVTTTVDFANAFVQSYLPDDEPVWMHVPRGYTSTNGREYCLKLIKSLYGHRRAPQLWVNHSAEAFRKLGLVQSKHDPCLWFGKDIMLVQYVDDCGISAPTQDRIDKFVSDLRKLNFELTLEESFAEFLGIKFETLTDGSIKCTQRGLIKKTLEAAGMENCNPNSIPTTQTPLGADKTGPPMDDAWNYRGICGMLLYLSTNTRPDIAFAVSQVCRFGHDPRKSHATAVKSILRYLKKTQDDGMIIKPAGREFNLDLYVDADFCGLFGQEDPRDPNSVRSRTGYLVMLCGWPIIWKSQLQTHVSQSTLEAEYSAMSAALRVFLPLKLLIKEIVDKTRCRPLRNAQLHSTVFQDNQSSYFLATNQRLTGRTRYLLAKWHWFWDAYNRQEFIIVKCPTTEMWADYLTKPLPRATFETNRGAVQGW